jgi:hypothetical protein
MKSAKSRLLTFLHVLTPNAFKCMIKLCTKGHVSTLSPRTPGVHTHAHILTHALFYALSPLFGYKAFMSGHWLPLLCLVGFVSMCSICCGSYFALGISDLACLMWLPSWVRQHCGLWIVYGCTNLYEHKRRSVCWSLPTLVIMWCWVFWYLLL